MRVPTAVGIETQNSIVDGSKFEIIDMIIKIIEETINNPETIYFVFLIKFFSRYNAIGNVPITKGILLINISTLF